MTPGQQEIRVLEQIRRTDFRGDFILSEEKALAAIASLHAPRTNEVTPAGFVMVPKAKLEEWRYNASKARRAGHICDADRMCMSLEQSIKAMLSAIPRPEQEG